MTVNDLVVVGNEVDSSNGSFYSNNNFLYVLKTLLKKYIEHGEWDYEIGRCSRLTRHGKFKEYLYIYTLLCSIVYRSDDLRE